jgi:L-alanine-DL-glutamate epimerase-like enolase superfamily enzyme
MKITNIEVFALGDPYPDPEDAGISELAFVRISTNEGISGISEIFAVPAGVAKAALHGPNSFFGRLLIGEDPLTPERLWKRLYNSMVHGNRRGWAIICLGAVDVAIWDIYGKALRRPVYQLLGGREIAPAQVSDKNNMREVVPYCTIVSHEWDAASVLSQQLEKVSRLRDLGYRAFKVEPMNSTPETVVTLARHARQILGPHALLAVDVGYLWNDVGMALRVAEQLYELDIFFLETPFPVDSLPAYATLAAKTSLRLAAGEHTVTQWEFLDLMDRGGVSVIQPYMSTVGGLTEAKRLIDLALPRGVLICPGNWSTHVLSAATVHLAAISPITPVFEYVAAEIYSSPLRKALAELGFPVVNGAVRLPSKPGIGFELPQDLIEHFRIA